MLLKYRKPALHISRESFYSTCKTGKADRPSISELSPTLIISLQPSFTRSLPLDGMYHLVYETIGSTRVVPSVPLHPYLLEWKLTRSLLIPTKPIRAAAFEKSKEDCKVRKKGCMPSIYYKVYSEFKHMPEKCCSIYFKL